jgi:hypothetical protein
LNTASAASRRARQVEGAGRRIEGATHLVVGPHGLQALSAGGCTGAGVDEAGSLAQEQRLVGRTIKQPALGKARDDGPGTGVAARREPDDASLDIRVAVARELRVGRIGGGLCLRQGRNGEEEAEEGEEADHRGSGPCSM